MKANKLYIENCLGARDDAKGMQYLIPGWTFDPKRTGRPSRQAFFNARR